MNRKSLLVFVLTVCMAGSAFADSLPVLCSKFAIDANGGIPRVGENFTLTFKARADYDANNVTVLVTVPDGIACLDDSTRYTVSCAAGESTAIDVHLRCESPGPYHIQAHTLMTPAETLHLFQYLVTDYYISVFVNSWPYFGFRGNPKSADKAGGGVLGAVCDRSDGT